MLRHVDLCSGIGGFALGFQWAGLSEPVLFCDIEPWSRQVLRKHWPDVPIAEDVKELANDPRQIPECAILTAGYPCQPFSQAGQRRGAEDDRHIWPYISQIVAHKRPTWCVFENVYGHVSLGLDEVLSDLEAQGYAARTFIVPACGVDAPHKRDRLWIVARNVGDADSVYGKGINGGEPRQAECGERLEGRRADVAHADIIHGRAVEEPRKPKGQTWGKSSGDSGSNVAHAESKQRHERHDDKRNEASAEEGVRGEARASRSNVAHAECERQQGQRSQGNASDPEANGEGKAAQFVNGRLGNFWLPEPAVGRVANGIPRRVDRLKGLGNAIVPQIAMQIGLTIKQVEHETREQHDGLSKGVLE